jgi:aryl-alcohol dehydrogenase-like predicted oxidoreductase
MTITIKVYLRLVGIYKTKAIIKRFKTSLKELKTNYININFSIPFKLIDILKSNKLDRLFICYY